MASTDDGDQLMVTTLDNPYNPFTQFDEWYALDKTRGYHTPGLLARYVISADDLSDEDQTLAINQGIQELIQDNPYGMYKAVRPSDFDPETTQGTGGGVF